MDIDFNTYDEYDYDINSEFYEHDTFHNFLIEHNMLDDYIIGFYNDKSPGYGKNKFGSIDKFLSTVSESYYVSSAFVWETTPIKYKKWSDINYKWLKYINRI